MYFVTSLHAALFASNALIYSTPVCVVVRLQAPVVSELRRLRRADGGRRAVGGGEDGRCRGQ